MPYYLFALGECKGAVEASDAASALVEFRRQMGVTRSDVAPVGGEITAEAYRDWLAKRVTLAAPPGRSDPAAPVPPPRAATEPATAANGATLFKVTHPELPRSRPQHSSAGTTGGHPGHAYVWAHSAAAAVARYLSRHGLNQDETPKTSVAVATDVPGPGEEVLHA